jgi:heat shock protein HslJ
MKRMTSALIAVAVAGLMPAAVGCSATASGSPASSAPAGFAGYQWNVVEIYHAGTDTPIPARYDVYLRFAPDGQFGANEPVNYHSGTYHQADDGFTTSGMASTAAGYAGQDPVVMLSRAAISAFGDGGHATARLAGNRLTVTVGGFVLTCQRAGRQGDFPPAQPT